MSARKTVLLLSRGTRTRRLFLDMARNLAEDHRIVVMSPEWTVADFSSMPSVEVRRYHTADIDAPGRPGRGPGVGELRGRVREIEERLGLPVYKAASNYLLYGRFVKQYGGRWGYLEREEEILRAFVGAYDELSRVFEETRPDVVFYETLDFIASYVAFALARSRGVFGLEFRFSPLGQGRVFPAFGLFRRNVLLEHLYEHRDAIRPESYASADDVLSALRERLGGALYAKMHRTLVRENSPFNPRRILPALLDPRSAVRGLQNIRWHARCAANRLWLGRHLSRQVPEQPYLIFFMQHIPEASTCSEAPRWVDQDMVIEQLAINAPGHLRVVVKEHPRSYGHRGPAFFGPLQNLPNVTLCHPSTDNYELISGAEAVVAINGSVGLEGILLGKRVGILGRSSYSIYRGARLLDHPEEIYDALRDATWHPEEMVQERRGFLAAYLQASYPFGHGSGLEIYPSNGGDLWAEALRQTMAGIERYGLQPSACLSGLPADPVSVPA